MLTWIIEGVNTVRREFSLISEYGLCTSSVARRRNPIGCSLLPFRPLLLLLLCESKSRWDSPVIRGIRARGVCDYIDWRAVSCIFTGVLDYHSVPAGEESVKWWAHTPLLGASRALLGTHGHFWGTVSSWAQRSGFGCWIVALVWRNSC